MPFKQENWILTNNAFKRGKGGLSPMIAHRLFCHSPPSFPNCRSVSLSNINVGWIDTLKLRFMKIPSMRDVDRVVWHAGALLWTFWVKYRLFDVHCKKAYITSCTKIELRLKIYPLWWAAPCVKIVELWHNQKKSYMQIELEWRAKLLISVYCNDSYPVNFFVGAEQKRLYPKYLYPIPNKFKNENTTITSVSTQDNHFQKIETLTLKF